MNTPEQDAIAAATRLLESVGTITNPNEDYPIYRLYPVVCDLCARVHKGYRMWVLERIEDSSLVFCDGSPSFEKEKVVKLAVQRARDNGFNYRAVPIEISRESRE